MDRLISQFEVITAIEKYTNNIFTKSMGDLIKDIKAIPPAEPKIVPIANIHFDEDKMCEVCKEVAENIVVEYDFKGKTNGEVIKAMFGDDKVSEFMGYARIMARVGNWFNDGVVAEFDKDWWNSPYEPQEGANE